MPIIDVTAPSNWSSVTCGLTQYSEETVGWNGSAYLSEGQVYFSNSLSTSGKRINRVYFNYYALKNPDGWGGTINPWMKIVVDGGGIVFDATIKDLTNVSLPSYDETLYDISYVKISAVPNWTIYMYAGGGGTGYTDWYLTVYDLSFSYDLAVPPYVWTTYRNTKETIVD